MSANPTGGATSAQPTSPQDAPRPVTEQGAQSTSGASPARPAAEPAATKPVPAWKFWRRAEVATDTGDIEAWRGVKAESAKEISDSASVFLAQRSRRLLGELLRPYAKYLWILILAVLCENIARLSIPKLVQAGIDRGIPPLMDARNPRTLLVIVATMVVAVAAQTLARIFFLRLSGRFGEQIMLELRRRLFRKFQQLDVQFHDRYTSGRVISRLTNDLDAIHDLVASGLDSIITAVFTFIGVGALLIWLDWRLGLLCLLAFPVILLVLRWFSTASTKVYRRVREMAALVIVQFVETMTGIRAVQAYRREPRNQDIFTDVATRYADANTDSFRLNAVFMPAIRLVGNITTGVALMVGGLFVMDGSMSIGALAAFLLYLRMFFEPMSDLSQFYNTLQSALSALEKVSGVLEEKPLVEPAATPVSLPHARGEVDFNHVGFSYVEGHPVLPDLDLHLAAGETIALVGTTGAGKTTIAKLIARFYDPTSGAITLDGVDLRELSDEDLRRAVVMVTQENFMFDGSIEFNIGFGNPDATPEQIRAAAHAVGADTFIDKMPEGYATDVGKRGGRLSAGQRQLIAFARAFLADPAVLILDEATSSLDIPSERLVQRALQTILADRTAVIIAHRLSTVEIADRVIVLEHGEIMEQGSPAELIGNEGGRYAALHDAWAESLA